MSAKGVNFEIGPLPRPAIRSPGGGPICSFLVEYEVFDGPGHLPVVTGDVHDGVQSGRGVPGGQDGEPVLSLGKERRKPRQRQVAGTQLQVVGQAPEQFGRVTTSSVREVAVVMAAPVVVTSAGHTPRPAAWAVVTAAVNSLRRSGNRLR